MVEGVIFLQENETLPPCDLSRKSGKAAFSTACPWDTQKFYMLGGSEFRLRQGFGPQAQNACTAQSAAPSAMGP